MPFLSIIKKNYFFWIKNIVKSDKFNMSSRKKLPEFSEI
jgi:hypothetical protein